MIEEFRRAIDNRHERARALKDQGKRIMGWMCSYVPEELLHACGFVTVRAVGGKEDTSTADAHLYINMCSLVRSTLEEAMRGKYSYLDGLVTLNTCDNIRRLYDVWVRYSPPPFYHILSLPRKVTPASVDFFRSQLEELKTRLEELSGKKTGEAELQHAIRLFNRAREMQRGIASLRSQNILSGSDIFTVNLAAGFLPKEEYLSMLEDLANNLKDAREGAEDRGVRLMVMGSEIDDPDLISLIESCGANVVVEDLCTGSKNFWNPVEEGTPDSLEALAKAYLARPPCPRMRMAGERREHLRKLIKDYSVQGVVHQSIKFCKLYEEDCIFIREELKQTGLPLLALSREYTLGGTGQYKTRLEAFIEALE